MNYQRNWKSAAVLKPEGSTISTGQLGNGSGNGNATAAVVPASNATTKYYKRSAISHPNQVPPY